MSIMLTLKEVEFENIHNGLYIDTKDFNMNNMNKAMLNLTFKSC